VRLEGLDQSKNPMTSSEMSLFKIRICLTPRGRYQDFFELVQTKNLHFKPIIFTDHLKSIQGLIVIFYSIHLVYGING
jgi:hypothetical protein